VRTLEDVLEMVVSKGPEIFVIDNQRVLALPPGWTKEGMEEYQDRPNYITETQSFIDQASFCAYVSRFKNSNSWIRLCSSKNGAEATAFLDYHAPDMAHDAGPWWNGHRAEYRAQHSEAWAIWHGSNNEWMNQTRFADFIYDNQADISGMPGAELLEIVQQLKVTAKADCRDMRDRGGSVDMVYRVTVATTNASTDKTIILPSETEITVPLYKGGEKMTFKVDFKIKVATGEKEGAALFAYRLYRPDTVILDHHKTLAEALSKATGLPVWS